MTRGSISLGGNGSSKTINDCSFTKDGGIGDPHLVLSDDYTINSNCIFSNAYLTIVNNCVLNDEIWRGENTVELYSGNRISNLTNCNLIVKGGTNCIDSSYFTRVSITSGFNKFIYNIVASEFDEIFTGDHNEINSNIFFSTTRNGGPKITGNYNSFSNNIGAEIIGDNNYILNNVLGLDASASQALGV